MAASNSFDVTTGVDMMEVQNAVDQATKEITQRYDFKGLAVGIALDVKAKTITLTAPDDNRMAAVWDVLQSKMVKRKVPLKNLKPGKIESAARVGSEAGVHAVVARALGVLEREAEVAGVLQPGDVRRIDAVIARLERGFEREAVVADPFERPQVGRVDAVVAQFDEPREP